jgi:hypothetical protein
MIVFDYMPLIELAFLRKWCKELTKADYKGSFELPRCVSFIKPKLEQRHTYGTLAGPSGVPMYFSKM